MGAPTIDVIYSLEPPVEGTLRVVLDQRAIAVTAADHLRGQGFEQFAFCGYPGILWSDIRQRQFVEYLRESGRKVFEYQRPSGRRRTFETKAELNELWHTEALMRWIYLAVIILFAAAAIIFAVQNLEIVTMTFLGIDARVPLALLVAVAYLLGAATGGSLFALLRRSYEGSRRSVVGSP